MNLIKRSDLFRDHKEKWSRCGLQVSAIIMTFNCMSDEQLARDNNLKIFREGVFC
jgi:hypothetical protein